MRGWSSLHRADVRPDGDLHLRQGDHFLGREPRRHLVEDEPSTVPAQERQVRHHVTDAALSGEGVGALLAQLRPALAVGVLHHDDEIALAGEQVHRAADAAPLGVLRAPVRDAAALIDFVRAEDHRVDVAASRHLEGGDAVEEGGAGRERDELAGGVVDVRIDLVLFRHHPAVAEHAVFRVEDHVAAQEVVRHHRGNADAQVHVRPILDQPAGILRDAGARQGGFAVIEARRVGRPSLPAPPQIERLRRLHHA